MCVRAVKVITNLTILTIDSLHYSKHHKVRIGIISFLHFGLVVLISHRIPYRFIRAVVIWIIM